MSPYKGYEREESVYGSEEMVKEYRSYRQIDRS